jgi:hypothetical protein
MLSHEGYTVKAANTVIMNELTSTHLSTILSFEEDVDLIQILI